jgi:nicotinate-nucleotide adenylyltransferase
MLRLALKGAPYFWLSRCELERPAPSYAIDTAHELLEAFPRAQLFWLIGGDQVPDLDKWHESEELQRLATFVQLARGGSASDPEGTVPGLPRPRRIDISATEIRRRVKSCLPIDHLVPGPIAAYIQRHGLYGA